MVGRYTCIIYISIQLFNLSTFIDVRQHANPNTVIMLIGNKNDLEKNRQVSREEAEKFAQDNDLFFLETSAKSSENVEQAFEKTAAEIQKKIQNGTIDMNSEVSKIRTLLV